jgi:hypothetical protein
MEDDLNKNEKMEDDIKKNEKMKNKTKNLFEELE